MEDLLLALAALAGTLLLTGGFIAGLILAIVKVTDYQDREK